MVKKSLPSTFYKQTVLQERLLVEANRVNDFFIVCVRSVESQEKKTRLGMLLLVKDILAADIHIIQTRSFGNW